MQRKKLPKGISFQPERTKPFLVRSQDQASGRKILCSFQTLAEAESAIEAFRRQTEQTHNKLAAIDAGSVAVHKTECCLDVLLPEWWTAYSERLATTTRSSHRLIYEDLILPFFGSLKLREVTREKVIEFISSQRNSVTQFRARPSEKTILNRLGVLAAFLDEMEAQGHITVHAVRLARKAEFNRGKQRLMKTHLIDKLREKVLTVDQTQALLSTAQNWFAESSTNRSHPWHKGEPFLPLLVVVNTGLRIGEVAALKFGDFKSTDALGRPIAERSLRISKTLVRSMVRGCKSQTLEQNHTKGKTSRNVPVHAELAKILDEWRLQAESWGYPTTDSDPMFPIAHEFAGFKSLVRRIAEKAGVPAMCRGIHTLRHTAATMLLLDGKSVHELKMLLGHGHIQTTEKYLHAQGHTPHGVTASLAWTCSDRHPDSPTSNVRSLQAKRLERTHAQQDRVYQKTERQEI